MADQIEDFMRDIEDYYGTYKAQHRDVTKQYITKRFYPDDLQLLKKYIYENLHANYGAPTVSGIKRAASLAYSEDGVRFGKPLKKKDSSPLRKCTACTKLFEVNGTTCPWCGDILVGSGEIYIPPGFFD